MNYLKLNFRVYALMAIAMMMSSISFAQTTSTDFKIGELTFVQDEIDYGTVTENSDGERTFVFENTGNAPIVITDVKTSCGCTVPEYQKTAILPGQTSEIKVKYSTKKVGAFNKTITVISNAKEPNKVLRIMGEVEKTQI